MTAAAMWRDTNAKSASHKHINDQNHVNTWKSAVDGVAVTASPVCGFFPPHPLFPPPSRTNMSTVSNPVSLCATLCIYGNKHYFVYNDNQHLKTTK